MSIAITKGLMFTDASEHIEIQYHYVRELIQDGTVDVAHVPSGEDTADLLTKGLARVLHQIHTRGAGIK